MHNEDIEEDITVTINVNGKNMAPIVMGKLKPDDLYETGMQSYSQGHVLDMDGLPVVYDYMVRLSRRKTHEEEAKGNVSP
jgi:hypothetical protein